MARTLPEANPFSVNLLPVWGKGISPGFSELGSAGESLWGVPGGGRLLLQFLVAGSQQAARAPGKGPSLFCPDSVCRQLWDLSEPFTSLTVETMNSEIHQHSSQLCGPLLAEFLLCSAQRQSS